MKNYLSPGNHPDSFLSGATIESMVEHTKKMGLEYFSCTDHGYLTGAVKSYNIAKKKKLKPIIGIELYFKDNHCNICQNTPSEKIKYFKCIVNALDQVAYQKLAEMTSEVRPQITQFGVSYPLFDWSDLEVLSKYNVTVSTADIEDMVSKHLLVGQKHNAIKYYKKLKELFKDNYYPAILPIDISQYWKEMVQITSNDMVYYIPARDRVITDSSNRAKAVELTYRFSKHKKILNVFVNKIKYPVEEKYQTIDKAVLINQFEHFGYDLQEEANKTILLLAKSHGDLDRVLINHYAYYADSGDKIVQDMKLGEEHRIYQKQHIQTSEESFEFFKQTLKIPQPFFEKLIENTHNWAKRFDGFELKYNYQLVDYGPEPEKIMMEIINKVGRMKWDNPIYVKQFQEEKDLLVNNGVVNLVPYFLPIVEVIEHYKKHGRLVSVGRGSAAGFLLSYLMGITQIDPIRYGLYSSRFLTLDRVLNNTLPDIDVDLESRELLVGNDGNGGFLKEKYDGKYAQISTRTLLRLKSSILDACRFVNGSVDEEVTKLSKSLPSTPQGVEDYDFIFGYEKDGNHVMGIFEQNKDLQKYAETRPKEWEIVKKSLSMTRQFSRHACSYVLSSQPIEKTVPIMKVGLVDRVTQLEAKDVEFAGMIKYDFLVINAAKKIRVCLNYINTKNKEKPEVGYFTHQGKLTYVWDLPEDQDVFTAVSEGKTETVFQLNTVSVLPFVKAIKPKSIEDFAVITSLVRPGPLDFVDPSTGRNMAEEYIERRFGRSKSDIPILDQLLPETYGVLTYQEQLNKLAINLAGMSAEDGENVRIATAKKKPKLMAELKPKFVDGASKKVTKEEAEKIWDIMETFAGYSFNLSHAISYSVVSYACAFLKYHYPLEWWAAILSTEPDKTINEEFYPYIKDMVLPPDINVSTEQISIDYDRNKLRSKLSMITGLGEKAANKIMESRPYSDIKDFVRKKVAGDSLAKKLIHVGVLDSLFNINDSLLSKIHQYEKAKVDIEFENKRTQYENEMSLIGVSIKDEKEIKKLTNKYNKFLKDGPKEPKFDPVYQLIEGDKLLDFQMKKAVFPTINLDLYNIVINHSKQDITPYKNGYKITFNKENFYVSGEVLQKLDETNVRDKVYMVCSGYILDCEIFSYHKTKKALKILIDSSGYISEKVLWPNYETQELKYDPRLKKGAIAHFVYYKKPDSPYTNIIDIIIEKESIL